MTISKTNRPSSLVNVSILTALINTERVLFVTLIYYSINIQDGPESNTLSSVHKRELVIAVSSGLRRRPWIAASGVGEHSFVCSALGLMWLDSWQVFQGGGRSRLPSRTCKWSKWNGNPPVVSSFKHLSAEKKKKSPPKKNPNICPQGSSHISNQSCTALSRTSKCQGGLGMCRGSLYMSDKASQLSVNASPKIISSGKNKIK